jgi:DNA-directed RNA polymerase subunit omega
MPDDQKTIEELMDKVKNKYALALIAAKRARMLNLGAPKKVDIKSTKPAIIAIYETALGKIKYKEVKDKK